MVAFAKLRDLPGLSRHLGVSRYLLTRDIRAGRLRAVRIGGRIFVADNAIRDYLASAEVRAASEPPA